MIYNMTTINSLDTNLKLIGKNVFNGLIHVLSYNFYNNKVLIDLALSAILNIIESGEILNEIGQRNPFTKRLLEIQGSEECISKYLNFMQDGERNVCEEIMKRLTPNGI